MLVSTARPKFSALHDLAKQLVVWVFNSRQGFHCSNGNWCIEEQERYEHRQGEYDFRRGRYDDRRGRYDDRRGWFGDRRGRYDDRRKQYDERGGRLDDRRRNFNQNSMWESGDFSLKKKEFNLDTLVEHKKNFYTPHPDVLNRSQEEIQKFYSENEISTFGGLAKDCPKPIFNFEELDLPSEAKNLIQKLNFARPTPIQSMTWPIALSGYNMVGVAQTGSGKTLGFVLPGMIHLKNQPQTSGVKGPIALVISPTRELVQQTEKVLSPFARSFGFRTAAVFGGNSKFMQYERLRIAEACVGTPGRLLDFLKESSMELSRCTYVVLDEADRLLDMGFEPQIRAIMSQMRPDSQILMWSATWPKEVKILASEVLKNYIGVKFGSSELTVNSNITQRILVCKEEEKLNLLSNLLSEVMEDGGKTLIFCQTKKRVDFLQRMLKHKGFRVRSIHSGFSQSVRNNALSDFRSGKAMVLIGTAVVARGLDVNDIKNVINYDFPTQLEDYVHVVGRTGRCSNKGTAHTFFTRADIALAKDLIKLLRESNQEVSEELLELLKDPDDGYESGMRSNYRRLRSEHFSNRWGKMYS